MNRATKKLFHARSNFWEAGYYCEGSKVSHRRYAKREASRARRRLDKALIDEAG